MRRPSAKLIILLLLSGAIGWILTWHLPPEPTELIEVNTKALACMLSANDRYLLLTDIQPMKENMNLNQSGPILYDLETKTILWSDSHDHAGFTYPWMTSNLDVCYLTFHCLDGQTATAILRRRSFATGEVRELFRISMIEMPGLLNPSCCVRSSPDGEQALLHYRSKNESSISSYVAIYSTSTGQLLFREPTPETGKFIVAYWSENMRNVVWANMSDKGPFRLIDLDEGKQFESEPIVWYSMDHLFFKEDRLCILRKHKNKPRPSMLEWKWRDSAAFKNMGEVDASKPLPRWQAINEQFINEFTDPKWSWLTNLLIKLRGRTTDQRWLILTIQKNNATIERLLPSRFSPIQSFAFHQEEGGLLYYRRQKDSVIEIWRFPPPWPWGWFIVYAVCSCLGLLLLGKLLGWRFPGKNRQPNQDVNKAST